MLGRFLFRWRGVIGFLAFGVVFWLARPTFGSCLLGLPMVLVGLAVRFWASGYIGIEGRAREIGASRRLVSGPYRLLRHPLYVGNFLLVAGMLLALRPPLWLAAVVLAGFVVEYTLIVVTEEKDLAAKGKVERGNDKVPQEEECLPGLGGNAKYRMQNAEGKMGEEGGRSEKLEARSQSAEVPTAWRRESGEERQELSRAGGNAECKLQAAKGEVADGRSQKREARVENAEFQMADGGGREAEGESFSAQRALCEWRTWVATGVAWGLGVVKALVRS